MTPCHPMRTACVRAGTSPRAAWWASWSTPLNSSARSVLTGVPGPPRGPDSQRHECQSSPRAGRTSCWAVQGWGGGWWPQMTLMYANCISSAGSQESLSSLQYSGFHGRLFGCTAVTLYYFHLIGWKLGHREVKWLAQGYTTNDEACSHSLVFPLVEKNIGAEPLGGEGGNRWTGCLSDN